MIANTVLILAMAAGTYLTRVIGFTLSGKRMPETLERFLRYVPVAAFAALIASGMEFGTAEMWPRLIAGAIGAVVALRWRTLWLTLLVGMVGYWLASVLIG
jgi:branched-subunit amino acid transport protein